MTVYSLVLACALPLAGWIATRFGAKVVFQAATGIFLLGSLACGLAHSFAVFIAARALQGLGGAAMNPVGRIIVLQTTPRAKLLAANNAITWPGLIAPLAGPLIGGFVTARFGWRWNFLLNIPIGLACMGLAQKFVPTFAPDRRAILDAKGFLLSSTALGALLFGLGELCAGAAGVAAFAGVAWGIVGGVLAWHHLRVAAHPVVRLSVLQIPSFRLASLTAGMATRVSSDAFRGSGLVLSFAARGRRRRNGWSRVFGQSGFKRDNVNGIQVKVGECFAGLRDGGYCFVFHVGVYNSCLWQLKEMRRARC